jgi:hypothetical protein
VTGNGERQGSDPPELAPEGPTELVPGEHGELVERLSGGTATLLLIWLIGIGALSTLLAAWLYVWIVSGTRMGAGSLFGGFGFYVALAGASGPCILWLAGRAQGRSLGWFAWTAARIALVMVGLVLLMLGLWLFALGGILPGPAGLLAGAIMVGMAILLSPIWAVATWAADRWIARARVRP